MAVVVVAAGDALAGSRRGGRSGLGDRRDELLCSSAMKGHCPEKVVAASRRGLEERNGRGAADGPHRQLGMSKV